MASAPGDGASGEVGAFSDLARAADAWRARHGRRPPAFVSDITTKQADARADAMVACLVSCGFELHRNGGVDDVAAMVAGVQRSRARLVLLCARGQGDPAAVCPFVLAIPDVDFILVTGDAAPAEETREGDPCSRGYHVDPIDEGVAKQHWLMQFVMRSLGVA